jgi:hypothetical protein
LRSFPARGGERKNPRAAPLLRRRGEGAADGLPTPLRALSCDRSRCAARRGDIMASLLRGEQRDAARMMLEKLDSNPALPADEIRPPAPALPLRRRRSALDGLLVRETASRGGLLRGLIARDEDEANDSAVSGGE